MASEGIPTAALDIYEDLENDNSKAFWTEHKHVYNEAVEAPTTEPTKKWDEKRYGRKERPVAAPMNEPEPTLTLDEAYRAAYRFIHQYYLREPIEPFLLMLHSMTLTEPREAADPVTWHDWMSSVRAALTSDDLPPLGEDSTQ